MTSLVAGRALRIGLEFPEEPRPCEPPFAFDRTGRPPDHMGGLFDCEAREETHLDDAALFRAAGGQPLERFVEIEKIDVPPGRGASSAASIWRAATPPPRLSAFRARA